MISIKFEKFENFRFLDPLVPQAEKSKILKSRGTEFFFAKNVSSTLKWSYKSILGQNSLLSTIQFEEGGQSSPHHAKFEILLCKNDVKLTHDAHRKIFFLYPSRKIIFLLRTHHAFCGAVLPPWKGM